MGKFFQPTDILIPRQCQMEKWAVIACDQFTSDLSYWQRVRDYVSDAPSTLHMILPEAELANATDATVAAINRYMEKCLANGIFQTYENAYIYVERTLANGSVRQGVIGVVDLEEYHYDPAMHPNICATEMTVLERIPPRVAVRKDAPVEFTHVLLLCDDVTRTIIEPLREEKSNLPKLYEFDLMENGGRIAAWLLQGEDARKFDKKLDAYEQKNTYLVGDGNHSLVTAKTCYENIKNATQEDAYACHPARYALVELGNVHSSSLAFEPIHRILTNVNAEKLLQDLQSICSDTGEEVKWFCGNHSGSVRVNTPEGELTVGVLQDFLDKWLQENSGEIDYIHGDDAVKSLATQEMAVGFLLPAMQKYMLFPFVKGGRTLPRKTFSMGHGFEKRYYLEGRKIK